MAANENFKDQTSPLFVLLGAAVFVGVALLSPLLRTLSLIFAG